MRIKSILLIISTFLSLSLFAVLGKPIRVTKNNQSSCGLDFKLELVRKENCDGAIAVNFSIQHKELKNIEAISLYIVDSENKFLCEVPIFYSNITLKASSSTLITISAGSILISEKCIKNSIIVISTSIETKRFEYHILLGHYPLPPPLVDTNKNPWGGEGFPFPKNK